MKKLIAIISVVMCMVACAPNPRPTVATDADSIVVDSIEVVDSVAVDSLI